MHAKSSVALCASRSHRQNSAPLCTVARDTATLHQSVVPSLLTDDVSVCILSRFLSVCCLFSVMATLTRSTGGSPPARTSVTPAGPQVLLNTRTQPLGGSPPTYSSMAGAAAEPAIDTNAAAAAAGVAQPDANGSHSSDATGAQVGTTFATPLAGYGGSVAGSGPQLDPNVNLTGTASTVSERCILLMHLPAPAHCFHSSRVSCVDAHHFTHTQAIVRSAVWRLTVHRKTT